MYLIKIIFDGYFFRCSLFLKRSIVYLNFKIDFGSVIDGIQVALMCLPNVFQTFRFKSGDILDGTHRLRLASAAICRALAPVWTYFKRNVWAGTHTQTCMSPLGSVPKARTCRHAAIFLGRSACFGFNPHTAVSTLLTTLILCDAQAFNKTYGKAFSKGQKRKGTAEDRAAFLRYVSELNVCNACSLDSVRFFCCCCCDSRFFPAQHR